MKVIIKNFNCNNNELISLEGFPKHVGRDIFCRSNSRHFTIKEIREVCDIGGGIDN